MVKEFSKQFHNHPDMGGPVYYIDGSEVVNTTLAAATANNTAALAEGYYAVWALAGDIYISVGIGAVAEAAADLLILDAVTEYRVIVFVKAGGRISGYSVAGTTMKVLKVG